MLKIVLIIAALIVIWILQLLVCFFWCTIRKRKEYRKRSGTSLKVEEASGGNKGGLRQKIILCLDGFILYKLKCIGRYPSGKFRVFLLKHIFSMNIGKNVTIYSDFEIRAPWNISIGEGTIIGNECKLDGRNSIEIGKNVNLSTGVWIWTQQHDYNAEDFGLDTKEGKVVVGDYAWLSGRTILLPGVKIGEGAVVATGGVVTKDIDSYGLYGGVPVKCIGKRNENLKYQFDGTHLWSI